MSIQNIMTNSIYNLFKLKKYFKYIFIITLGLLYYFGIFTHLFELDYYSQFVYPLETDISKCVINAQSGEPNQPPCININVLDYDLLLSNDTKCNGNIHLLVLVKSALNHFDRRRTIRQTWGFENRFSDVPTRTIFILGRSFDTDLENRIKEEHEKYGDIVQYNFVDEYYNT